MDRIAQLRERAATGLPLFPENGKARKAEIVAEEY
jgi:hypothetical protein